MDVRSVDGEGSRANAGHPIYTIRNERFGHPAGNLGLRSARWTYPMPFFFTILPTPSVVAP